MRSILAVGAHPDDIELGAGATLAAHRSAGDRVTMLVLTSGQRGPGGNPTGRNTEQTAACSILDTELRWGHLMDCTIEHNATTIDIIEEVMREVDADVVYTHHPKDSHQDHVSTASAVLSAARQSHSILHFQSPSSLEFIPSVYVDIEHFLTRKIDALRAHRSQVVGSAMVNLDAIRGSAFYWGAQARLPLAEAFSPSRLALNLVPTHDVIAEADLITRDADIAATTASHSIDDAHSFSALNALPQEFTLPLTKGQS